MQVRAYNKSGPRRRRHDGRGVLALALCALLCSLAARPAAGAFVNGVEQFNGTTKDPVTWDEYNPFSSDNAITQNDAINFQYVPPTFGFGSVNSDYTARTATVGIGQAASVDVRLRTFTLPANPPPFFLHTSFYLTDNTGAPGTSARSDNNFIELTLDPGTSGAALVGRGGNGGSHSLGTSIPGPVAFTPGSQYTLQIARPDANTARFSVFDAAGNLIGSTSADVTGLPATLYPAFGVSGFNIPPGVNYSIDFDNVRIVPEPSTAALAAALAAPLLLARRRRISCR